MEEVYIGMLGLRDSLPVYDANQNRIKRDVVKILNAQVNELGPCLRDFYVFTTLVDLDLMSNKLVDADLETLRVSCTLRSLNLSNNDLVEVPLNIENGLKNLTKIILQCNPSLNITRCIQNLCGLKKLKHLDLSQTNIETLPEDIRKIQTLEELNISDTKIQEGQIPVGVFSLKNLKLLITDESFGRYEGSQMEDLFRDQILERMDIHPTDKGEVFWKYSRGHALTLMKMVKSLEVKKQWPKEGSTVLELWLNSSMLGSLGDKGVDDLFKNMRNVKGFKQITLLSLCTNDLYQIPNLRHFDNIRQLGLCRNNLTGIPAHVLSLPNLTNLYITDNQIRSLIFNVDDFPALTELHLQGNPICRDYDAAEACLDSRQNLNHPMLAIQGLKEVMLRGTNLPRVESDELSEEEKKMHPEKAGYYPPQIPYMPPQAIFQPQGPPTHQYLPPSQGVPIYGPPVGVPPPTQRPPPDSVSPETLEESDIFKVLDASYVDDIDGETERNLRQKIETTNAWEHIAEELGMSRDEKDLLYADSKKDMHKTLTWNLLKKWEQNDKSLGSLYRLLISKGFKQPARILKDGVLNDLQVRGELQKRIGTKLAMPISQALPPYAQPGPYASQGAYEPGPQGPPVYPGQGYSMYQSAPQGVPYGQDPWRTNPDYRCSPPPSYTPTDDGRSRRTSQPESSLVNLPSDCKLPDVGSLTISNWPSSRPPGPYPPGSQYPPVGQFQGQEPSMNYFGKPPMAGHVSSLPATENQNFTGTPPRQKLSVDNTASYSGATEMKRVAYLEQESLQRSHLPVQARTQSPVPQQGMVRNPQMVPYAQQTMAPFASSQSPSQTRRGSEESDRVPCQNDDPSVTQNSQYSYTGFPQQTSMQASMGSYPNMSDTQEPAMTDERLYRKVLTSANSTETEPPGLSDQAILRKELSLHQDS